MGVILQKIVSLSIINISSNPLVSKSFQSMSDEFHQAWKKNLKILNFRFLLRLSIELSDGSVFINLVELVGV